MAAKKDKIMFLNSDLEISRSHKIVFLISSLVSICGMGLATIFCIINLFNDAPIIRIGVVFYILSMTSILIFYGIKLIMITKYVRKHGTQ